MGVQVPDSAPEIFAPGVTVQRLHQGRIAILTLTEFRQREAVNVYFDNLLKLVKEWQPDQPILLLVDASRFGIEWSQLTDKRAREVNVYLRQHNRMARGAIVLPYSTLASMIRFFLHRMFGYRGSRQVNQIFFSYAEALHWLETFL